MFNGSARRAAIFAALLPLFQVACFDPAILPGLECSSANTCPPNQVCRAGICHLSSSDNSKACSLLSRCCDLVTDSTLRTECQNAASPPSSSSSSDSSSANADTCVGQFCSIATSANVCVVAAVDYGCNVPMFGCGSYLNCQYTCTTSQCDALCLSEVVTPNGKSLYDALATCSFQACPDTRGGVCDTSAAQFDVNACDVCLSQAEDTGGPCSSQRNACVNDG